VPPDSGLSPDQWLTIPEVAQRLGMPIGTVRRRITQGSLEAELQPGARGPEYRVRLPSETIVHSTDATQEGPQEQPSDNPLSIVVTTLMDRLAIAEEERLVEGKAAVAWQAKGEALQDGLRRAYERLEEIERRPWWRRLLFGRGHGWCGTSLRSGAAGASGGDDHAGARTRHVDLGSPMGSAHAVR
jgi:hypothetical protein